MKVNVAELRRNPGAQIDIKLEGYLPSLENELAPEAALLSPVTAKLRINNSGTVIVVDGILSVRVLLNCSRCLKEFALNLHVSFNEAFREEGASGGMGMEQEDGIILFSGDIIDFTATIRDNLIAALPMKALCRENCRGLCPRCGQDLNQGECNCPKLEVDPRLAVLGKLLNIKRNKL